MGHEETMQREVRREARRWEGVRALILLGRGGERERASVKRRARRARCGAFVSRAVLAVALLCPAPCSPCCCPAFCQFLPCRDSWGPRPTPCPASAPRGQSRATPRLSNLGCCDELRLPIAVAVCLREYRRRLQALRGDETGSGGEARLDDDDDGVPGEDDETVLGAAPLDDAEVDSPALAFDRSSIQVLEEVTFVPSKLGVVAQWLQTLVSGSKEPLFTAPAPTGVRVAEGSAVRACC
jgi:hypothetical protein